MKKLLVVLFSLGLALGAAAQRSHLGYYGPVVGYYRPTVIVGVGAYAPFGYGYPYYPYGVPYGYNRPSKLDMQVEDIRRDYKDKIWSAKHDDALSKSERKAKVHELKTERDQVISDTKKNYYKK